MKKTNYLFSVMGFILISLCALSAHAQETANSSGSTAETLAIKSVFDATDGVSNFKVFHVDAPAAGDYYVEMWLLPAKLGPNQFTSYKVYVNEAYAGDINPTAGNWQAARIEDVETVGLVEGENVIAVATAAPEMPAVESIKVALQDADASFSSAAYTQYLEDAIEGKEDVVDEEGEEIALFSADASVASPVFYANVPLKYSFYTTFQFTKGEEIFITSSSAVSHAIDLQIHGVQEPIELGGGGLPDFPFSNNELSENANGGAEPTFSTFNVPKVTLNYTYATTLEKQSLNWIGISEQAINSTTQVATIRITVPKTGTYLLRMRSGDNGILSVADLNVNGKYYYEDAPIYFSYRPCDIPADGNKYASMTNCYNAGVDDPLLFMHGAGADRLVEFDDDCPPSIREQYGLSNRDAYVCESFLMPVTRLSVSNYSSSIPESKCSIYARVAVENQADAAALMPKAQLAPAIKATDSALEARDISIPKQAKRGESLTVTSAEKVKSIALYNLSGSLLARSVGSTLTIPASPAQTPEEGVCILRVETESGTVSEKILVD